MAPGQGVVAGGWTSLLNTTWVLVLLTVGFSVGFYLVTLLFRRGWWGIEPGQTNPLRYDAASLVRRSSSRATVSRSVSGPAGLAR